MAAGRAEIGEYKKCACLVCLAAHACRDFGVSGSPAAPPARFSWGGVIRGSISITEHRRLHTDLVFSAPPLGILTYGQLLRLLLVAVVIRYRRAITLRLAYAVGSPLPFGLGVSMPKAHHEGGQQSATVYGLDARNIENIPTTFVTTLYTHCCIAHAAVTVHALVLVPVGGNIFLQEYFGMPSPLCC